MCFYKNRILAPRKISKMDKIPSVDLRDFLSGEPERKQKFVNEIGKAYEEIGFVALKGAGSCVFGILNRPRAL